MNAAVVAFAPVRSAGCLSLQYEGMGVGLAQQVCVACDSNANFTATQTYLLTDWFVAPGRPFVCCKRCMSSFVF